MPVRSDRPAQSVLVHEADVLRVNRVWVEHGYEREAAGGAAHFFDDPETVAWEDWSAQYHDAAPERR